MTRVCRANRRGTILPMLAGCLIVLFTFVALAVDLGMLAVSRTHCQNAADVGALVGARTLNNKEGTPDSNRPQAITDARESIVGAGAPKPGNAHLSAKFVTGQVASITAGQYIYDTTTDPLNPQFRANFPGSIGAGQSWTAMRVTIATTQPTYFMRVLGINTMPTGATAVAVHRPRDVAFALDLTGSMGYSSQFNTDAVQSITRSLNPDNLVPVFGHYVSVQNNIRATANLAAGNGEAFPRNNYSISTRGGPPIVRGFYFDKANIGTPTSPVLDIATKTGPDGKLTADLLNAFHRWQPPELSPGDSSTYTPPTYNFDGYDPTHKGDEATPKGPVPAPDTFGSMTDGVVPYAGDRYRRANGSINKTDATWATGSATTRAATNALELLGYGVSSNIVQKGGPINTGPVGNSPNVDAFRDPVWEKWGYDLDVPKYRAWRDNHNLGNPARWEDYLAHPSGGNNDENSILVPGGTDGDRFKGYSTGPGYWGKTFFVWPPDPRPQHDWRLKFFQRSAAAGGGNLDPQGDNDGSVSANTPGVNQVLLSNSVDGNQMGQVLTGTSNYQINHAAILNWVRSTGPLMLPPNLRAGHVRYYTSIPDSVSAAGGSTEEARDQIFWRQYINHVLTAGEANLYGLADRWATAGTSIFSGTLNTWAGPVAATPWSGTDADGRARVRKPYMRYNDSPNRPRLHMWFGPLSMMDFLTSVDNWLPGTCSEAQCWQLKAGMSAVLDDIQKNRPNDNVGLAYFAASYTRPIVPIGQSFVSLKNALFYPQPLLSALNVPTPTTASVRAEYRPYNNNFSSKPGTDIPNAGGSTDPNTGLMLAFNMLSPSPTPPSADYGSIRGRRGASKIVILETDGVPNTWRGRSFTTAGYNSYYTVGGSSGNIGNNNQAVLDNTYPIVQQIVKTMQSTTSGDSGLSLPNAKALVYPVGFGDLFDATLAPGATTSRDQAHAFLAKVAELGGTGPAGATTLTNDQIITGPFATRIETLRACMERIFQSGVSVILIE
jgi:Flp pilus assembly protein TadG